MAWNHDMTRRAALGTLVSAGAGFALFGPRGVGERPPPGRKVLDYWEKWTGHEGRAMEEVVRRFNASQSRLWVRYLVTGTIHQKALIAISGGDGPDVVGLNDWNVPTYARAGAVVPLTDLAPRAGLNLTDYARGMRRVMTDAGKWWATINTAGTIALYYNKAAFRGAGLDPEKPPRTIEELDAMSAKLERFDTSGRMTRCGFLHLEPGWWSWHWGYHFGGTIFDEASNTFTIDSPENRAAFEWLASATRGRAATVNAFLSGLGPFGTDRMGFLTGEVAMVVQGPWLANQIAAFKPDLDYGVAPLPVSRNAGPEGPAVALIDTDVLMIPSTAKDPEASMAFIAFTQRQENVEHLALAHCKGSPMGKVSDGFFARHTNRGVRLHTELADSPRAFVSPRTSVWMEVKDLLDKMRNDVWNQTTPVEAALASAQETAQAALERVRRRAKLRGEAAYVPQPVAPEPRA